jgi:hypothetical protein
LIYLLRRTFKIVIFIKKLAITPYKNKASIEPEGVVIIDLLLKINEKKRIDKELVQKLKLNFKVIKELKEEIRKFEQPALKE